MATPIGPLRTLLRKTCSAACPGRTNARFASSIAGRSQVKPGLTPYFAYSHRFHPIARSTTFFSPSIRRLTTASFDANAALASRSATAEVSTTSAAIPRSLPNWLFGCSALVFGIVVIGGLTRLTESGLSITEWQPLTGILPPITDAEWNVEWEKYRVSPEGVL